MANTFQAHANAGQVDPIVRAQIEAVAVHPSARLEDQARARRWLAGMDGAHAEQYPDLAWTPAIEQRCREQCARAFAALLGLPASAQKAEAPRQVERCSSCGGMVEPDGAGPCCPGAGIEPGTQRNASDVLGLRRVTGESLSAAQIVQVHAALSGYQIALMDRRQRVLLGACERLMPDGMTDSLCQVLPIAELGAVSEMSIEACRELVAGAWNSAISSMQVAA